MSQLPPQSPPPNPYGQAPAPMSPADEKLWATLIHIGGILTLFLAPLVGYLVLKDRGPFVRGHSATALNFQITMTIVYVFLIPLTVITFGLGGLLYIPLGVVIVVFGIIAAVAANKGQVYFYPLAIPFVK